MLLVLGAAFAAGQVALAQMPYGGQPPYQTWQFRPMAPSNARGVAPQPPTQQPTQQTGQRPEQVPEQWPEQWPARGNAPGWGQPGGFPGPQQGLPRGYPQGGQAPGYPQGAPQMQPQMQGYPQRGQFPFQQPPQQSRYGQPGQYQPGQYQPGEFPPSQYQPGQYQPGQYQPAQRAPGGYYAPGGTQRGGLASASPRLEVLVNERHPYVQQNVLVRLRVVSTGNLATASPELSGYEDVLFDQLEGPTTSTRGSGNSQEIVNEYILTMTPLRDGPMEIAPLRVKGTLAGGVPFEAVAREPIQLDVLPPMATVRPWLPLRSLHIDAQLTDVEGMTRGRPATLTVELEAEGAAGDQLPSVESMLRSEDFRVYREQTIANTRLADNGRTLVGKRIEVYTLVPHSGGRLQLPEIRLNWWNVETASREASSEPIQVFKVAGKSGPFGFANSTRARAAADWQKYWLPVAGLALLLLGYWGGVWLRGRVPAGERAPLWPRVRHVAGVGARLAGRGLVVVGRALNPMPLLRGLGDALGSLAPRSTRVYQCAKAADSENEPAAWCLAFQRNACRRLNADAREPLPRMADRITALRPGANREQVQALMQALDRALYNRSDIDFPRWKRDFRRALRPGTGAIGSLISDRVRRARLPELNPRPAG
ncbi:MAG: BatD family protein [Thiohalocapsa sp.]|uniref:BatD family protein n=1 Tax=Thiohalocapsa sp. TaxID=2497641 RepID=UPI0025CD069F|nr:BatD family protein [Thiohalocapsa sp.]MCG6942998.1 BatD family protein [Thiohalocapsa sp.]